MDTAKAVCECTGMNADRLVVAVKQSRLGFIDGWGVFTWLMVIILAIMTSGLWVVAILIWHSGQILNPKYYCSQCGRLVKPQQFRV